VLFHCGKAINRARLWEPAAAAAQRPAQHRQMLVGFAALQAGPAPRTASIPALRNSMRIPAGGAQ
jgi:hypothetical protein